MALTKKPTPASGWTSICTPSRTRRAARENCRLNLLDALRAFQRDKALTSAMGDEFAKGYVKLKTDEWNSYMHHLTSWERDHTLDC